MAHPTIVLNVVGLNSALLAHAPRMSAFAGRHAVTRLRPVLPAVTCSVQASMLTGKPPRDHGVVANGWFDRELAEVHFWKQSNRLVDGGKVWHAARRRDAGLTTAQLFWWFNMYAEVEWSITPRPIYKADGRKVPDCYSEPESLRTELTAKLGRFPLFNFWGPMSNIGSSRWIAEAAKHVLAAHRPTLALVYLPHLDYGLQKLGPDHADVPAHVAEIDAVVGDLIDAGEAAGYRVMIVSEYGIEPVESAVAPNRALREAGLVRIRVEDGGELLDPGASRAFAVADHQVAHVYVRDEADLPRAKGLCRGLAGVERVLDREAQAAEGLDHPRSGELVLVAEAGRWFSHDYWLDDARAPDFQRTVEIFRKPGFDPRELFIDPAIRLPKLKLAAKLIRKRLGFRTLFDVVPLDASLVRGSHGRVEQPPDARPVMIGAASGASGSAEVPCLAVHDEIMRRLFE